MLGLPNEIFHTCKSWISKTPLIDNNYFLNFLISKSLGVVSNKISKISFVTGIETVNEIIINNIDNKGSINIQSYFK